ncbi:MAG: hypothetical protein COW00_17065 [Bdellovibrio sp. CG12_big_fil_rev_8_21_14_0_65_39_13]|nr:MAG: hypothetical protein COW78_00235 [Bdellovibrio sp. CG22_combo_CG10-13_8_21_14_all_39_27]PIQ58146.1 MAG: hypothetical protein COW00_17065 [Bdellovibrio sp. CG12_big_fil_rev_8_21_14_0_65_39_13]PIR34308.1 MAG: hypothetical protein COV37_13305 [Bdellovibrio sp. CG11_big_fil_rev_8_21_14_0_20_39_38]PJB53214.1 MAG: hypothetical protein CO099_08400 [Bdellovibrio sp. CG_4_9_14_3_um_filter_39_7]
MEKANNQSFYKSASMNIQILFVLASICMIAFSIYLTNHYFEIIFPMGLGSSTLCDINTFFNCDITTYSPFSNIAGIPISLFGLVMGSMLLIGYFFPTESVSSTLHFLLRVNLVGCVVLFLYSLFFLHGLCPFCTLYYISSAAAWYSMHHTKVPAKLVIKPLAIMSVVVLIASGLMWKVVDGKRDYQDKLATDLIRQFDSLPNLGAPAEDSAYRVASSTPKFTDAVIQITKFSDFQCPACKMLSEILEKVAKRYAGKINIQYVFYPLDPTCNPNMTNPLHQYACKASYLAACLPEKFPEVSHKIFANQNDLSDKWLLDYAKSENVLDCYQSPETKKKVMDLIALSNPFNIKSTPTSLINGIKVEGALPLKNLTAILDEIVRRHDGK